MSRWHVRLVAALALAACVAPARAGDWMLPTLENSTSVRFDTWSAIQRLGVTVDGTVFAALEFAPEGTKVTAYYGNPMSDPRTAALVQRLTEALRFRPTAGWRAAHPDGRWAVFWMFQTHDCDVPIYDAPRDVTAIRVCVAVRDGTYSANDIHVSFDVNVPLLAKDAARPVVPMVPCDYSPAMRRAGARGSTGALIHDDASGAVEPVLIIQSSGDPVIDHATRECLRRQRFVGADGGAPPPGYLRFGLSWQLHDGAPGGTTLVEEAAK